MVRRSTWRLTLASAVFIFFRTTSFADPLQMRTLYDVHKSSPTAASRAQEEAEKRKSLPPVETKTTVMPARPGDQDRPRFPLFVQMNWFFAKGSLESSDIVERQFYLNGLPSDQGTFGNSTHTSMPPLVTIGAFFPRGNHEIGWALGYLDGPKQTAEKHHVIPPDSREDETLVSEARIYRLTCAARAHQRIGGSWELRFTGGAGVCGINLRSHSSHTFVQPPINLNNPPYVINFARDFIGITADLGPSIAFVSKPVVIDVGISFVLFPEIPAERTSPALKINPGTLMVNVQF